MFKCFIQLLILALSITGYTYADKVVWTGYVEAKGTLTPVIKLSLGTTYQLRVNGTMNLGNWVIKGQPLLNDACYEFSDQINNPLKSFKNSLNISVCDGKYHEDHVYISHSFLAAQSGIHFWIDDLDYTDNSGNLQVELIEVSNRY